MNSWQWDVALFILASPILAVRAVVRFVRRVMFLRLTIRPTLTCLTCGATIHLLGMWRCGCGAHGRRSPPCGTCPGCRIHFLRWFVVTGAERPRWSADEGH